MKNNKSFIRLLKALNSLQSETEYEKFMIDICSVTELESISQRLEVATMLSEKKVYSKITQETGASTATISRVSRSLNHGTNGFKIAIERLRNIE